MKFRSLHTHRSCAGQSRNASSVCTGIGSAVAVEVAVEVVLETAVVVVVVMVIVLSDWACPSVGMRVMCCR